MISAILFLSFFVFLILGIPIGICLGLSSICAILYSGTSLTIVANQYVFRYQQIFAPCHSVLCIVRKHYGKSGHFQTTDSFRRHLRRP
ncbi:MAG: hypothetical protein ACLRIL_05180 [Fusicatenibacter saccharivorans]